MKKIDPEGCIFDVQRFCLHDGPGIRTTVFLQGCPLRCPWCHNPEGITQGRVISFRLEACQFCRSCEQACEHGCHSFVDGRHHYDRSLCKQCGKCVEACVYGALASTGEQQKLSQVISLVLRDEAYFKHSGGGLTLSGGEPLFQATFTHALLKAAKEAGLNTCVETCGQASRSAFEEIVNLVDLFLFDVKAWDPLRHKTLTGTCNRRILANLDYLYRQGAKIRLRFPLVPGLNDNEADLKGLAALANRYTSLHGIEIMPYHDLGRQKYQRFGIPDRLPELQKVDQEMKQRWLKTLQESGCTNVYLE